MYTKSCATYVHTCRFSDKLCISIADGTTFTMSLVAEGRGTTIVSQPPLLAGVDLGPHFSNGPCRHQFRLTNHGRRMQALSWTTEGFSAAKKKRAEIAHAARDPLDVGKMKKKVGEREEELGHLSCYIRTYVCTQSRGLTVYSHVSSPSPSQPVVEWSCRCSV